MGEDSGVATYGYVLPSLHFGLGVSPVPEAAALADVLVLSQCAHVQ